MTFLKKYLNKFIVIIAVLLVMVFSCLVYIGCELLRSKSEKEVIVVLVNGRQTAGYKSVYWDQKDGSGRYVPPGRYSAHVKYLQVDSSVEFEISKNAVHVPFPPDSSLDTCYSSTQGAQFPCANSLIYALGDTVIISYPLPEDTLVWLGIEGEIHFKNMF